jgi:hypothetical protein
VTSLPHPFLSVLVQDLTREPTLTGLCAGFEDGSWRAAPLARHLMSWVPDWALTREQVAAFDTGTGVELLSRALHNVYTSGRFEGRGELGELLLHTALRQVFGTDPAISKIAFKDSPNDVVKGFDCVHVVDSADGLELWLGEAKLYSDLAGAIREALVSVRDHLQRDYLRAEFAAVTDKIEPSWPHAAALRALLRPEASLDEVFRRVVVPVLVCYDSAAVARHTSSTEEYQRDAERELRDAARRLEDGLLARPMPRAVQIRTILLPLGSKELLVREWDARLRAWQATL